MLISKRLKNFYITFRGGTNEEMWIHPETPADNEKIIEMIEGKYSLHTFGSRSARVKSYVTSGLSTEHRDTQLLQWLGKLKLNPVKVTKMMKTTNPLFLATITNGHSLKVLNSKYSTICNVRFGWSSFKPKKQQCRRCQRWGHTASECDAGPRCVKCAASHYTYQCPKPPAEPAKCANCSGTHTACNGECEHYQQHLKTLRRKTPTAQPEPGLSDLRADQTLPPRKLDSHDGSSDARPDSNQMNYPPLPGIWKQTSTADACSMEERE